MGKDESAVRDKNYIDDVANKQKVYCVGESSNPTGPPPKSDFQTLDDFMDYEYEQNECANGSYHSSEGDDDGGYLTEEEISNGEPTEEEKRRSEADEIARQVRNDLYSFQMSEGTPITDHLSAMEARFVQLAELGHPMDSPAQNLIVSGSLNSFWRSLIARNKVKTAGLSTRNLYRLLLSLETSL